MNWVGLSPYGSWRAFVIAAMKACVSYLQSFLCGEELLAVGWIVIGRIATISVSG